MVPDLLDESDDSAYADCMQASERVSWTLDDVLPVNRDLDFGLPFLPDALVRLATAPLGLEHRLTLNHIRAHSYVNLFVFVEEYIISAVLKHTQPDRSPSPNALRALLRFAEEELKHQQLFRRFQNVFRRGFGHDCDVIANAVEVADYILSKDELAVMLVTLHLELITQQHYVTAIKIARSELDPSFRSLFEHHWLEESQHARIDALEIVRLSTSRSTEHLELALRDYADILENFDRLLARQTALDLDTLERISGTAIPTRPVLLAQQHASYRQNFLHDGFENAQFLRVMRRLFGDDGLRWLSALAARYR